MYLTKTCYCATDFHRLRQVNAVKSVVVVYSTLFINLAINWKSTSTDKKQHTSYIVIWAQGLLWRSWRNKNCF